MDCTCLLGRVTKGAEHKPTCPALKRDERPEWVKQLKKNAKVLA